MSASVKHLACSILVALLAATLVFGVWYPYPYRETSGGRELFSLLVLVDVIVGPLLTLVVFDRRKLRLELIRDLGVIVVLQFVALGYGLHSVHQARPVLLAFEGNRFRVVSAAELEPELLGQASEDFQELSQTGPRLIGVKLSKSGDADYLESVKQSLGGFHPAFRPSRWIPYEHQRAEVALLAKPLTELRARKPDQLPAIDAAVMAAALPIERLGYIPLQSRLHSDWVVIVDRQSGWPVGFASVDGW
jgi:hypothetical protein